MEPYLPEKTFALPAQELADEWVREFEEGIEGSGVRPGFIKTAVNPGDLFPIQQRITHAAAIASRLTGMTVATHTGAGIAAHQVLDILEEEEVGTGSMDLRACSDGTRP